MKADVNIKNKEKNEINRLEKERINYKKKGGAID